MLVAVFQRSLLFGSSRGTLKIEVVCFFITVSIPDYFVTVEGNNTIVFWIEMRSQNGGGTGFGVNFGEMLFYITFYRNIISLSV
jgi:hypothetical protein